MSDMPRNTIVLHAAGGCGISQSETVFGKISELGDGFANIKFNYLDTSMANINKITPRGEFWLVKTKEHSKAAIHGSGAERKFNALDIVANVNEYLDKNKYLKKVPNEFHVVICSASGGTGSVISAVLVQQLLSKNIPVIAVITGDSSNALSAINTLNTLASFTNIARAAHKALSVIYANNHLLVKDNGGMRTAEEAVDKILLNIMTTVSMFLSGQNEALDNQDMVNIIDQSQYKTIQIEPGLYGLTVHSKEIKLPEGSIPTVGRTLTLPGSDFDTNLTLLHHKRGYVDNENVINILKEESFPIHMLAYANFFKLEEENLKKITDDYYHIMNNIKQEHMTGASKSNHDDETGLVF